MPAKVYVRDLSKICAEDKVAVFHSSSGTGKTVELASTVATRGADFAFVLQFDHDIDASFKQVDPEDGARKAQRNTVALDMILNEIQEILRGNEDSFEDMVLGKLQEDEFRLAIAIDEAQRASYLREQ